MRIRRKKRVKIDKEVLVTRTVRAKGLDLSEDGMYIYSKSTFIPGCIVNVSFSLDDEPLDIVAKVRHIQPGVGFGVTFCDLKESVASKIRQYLAAVDAGPSAASA
ncbi:MAG: hypothetical protein Kow0025_22540 [Thermodesulfovibrionales bacterium]